MVVDKVVLLWNVCMKLFPEHVLGFRPKKISVQPGFLNLEIAAFCLFFCFFQLLHILLVLKMQKYIYNNLLGSK
jgi:predicted membrane protein